MNTNISSQLLIVLLINMMGCSPVIALDEGKIDSTKNDNVLPDHKVLESGQVLRRNAGTEWSRNKIKDYLGKIVMTRREWFNSPPKECSEVKSKLEKLDFEFVEPDLITDDWNDPRLNRYKKEVKDFKYALGYLEQYGPDDPMIPTWNINIYDVDTDNDGVDETILYGEKIKTKVGGGTFHEYIVFQPVKGRKTNGGIGDGSPSSINFKPTDYLLSGLVRFGSVYASLSVADFQDNPIVHRKRVQVYLLDVKNTYRPELGRTTWQCTFDFNFKNQ